MITVKTPFERMLDAVSGPEGWAPGIPAPSERDQK